MISKILDYVYDIAERIIPFAKKYGGYACLAVSAANNRIAKSHKRVKRAMKITRFKYILDIISNIVLIIAAFIALTAFIIDFAKKYDK